MDKKAKIVIVGGGIVGLATAYNLAKLGMTNIVILEKGFLNSGASGRCGGGIRQQWTTEDNVKLMIESIRLFEKFSSELGINIWFRQGGYLFLAKNQKEMDVLEENVRFQNELGVPSRIYSKNLIKNLAPAIDTTKIVGGSYNYKDGILFPWPVVWGYMFACKKLGVKIHTFTTVTAFEQKGDKITSVITNKGKHECDIVFNCAGAWSKDIAKLANVELPNKPVLHEILVTEPLKAFLKPMVVVLKSGLYTSQSLRGEIVTGINLTEEKETLNFTTSFEFLNYIANELIDIMPVFSEIKVMRQWSGPYDTTPDTSPIIGYANSPSNFILACGFMGHGFMMAPATGKLIAEWFVKSRYKNFIEKYNVNRFKTGKLIKERFIIG